ncbi:MAG TPA: hypothetical protein PKU78_06060 [Candidatus Dojkabacteria bacterium]|nr:hypothetical protein [Candidatus Dojkabacteria bacterium]HRO65760.1 hypothetical protein [Candidatus Dojkabacteria bacterium]HRP50778.1 hypothetical protein [Candidatus Dojkabacteria bacterium]
MEINSNHIVGHKQALMNYMDQLHDALNYRMLGNPVVAIGTSSKKTIKTTTAVACVNGVLVSVTGAETAFTATTHDIAANASSVQEAVYLVVADSAGTITLVMGDIAEGAGNALIPEVPSGKVALGYARIAIAAGATAFDASSDDLDAAHITDTYVSFGGNASLLGRFDDAWAPGDVTAE